MRISIAVSSRILHAPALRRLHARDAGAFSCERSGICPSCGAMEQTAAYRVDHVIPHVPARQWVLSFPIPLRSLFAVHPELLAPVLRIIHRVINTFLIKQTGVPPKEAATGTTMLIQRFGSAYGFRI